MVCSQWGGESYWVLDPFLCVLPVKDAASMPKLGITCMTIQAQRQYQVPPCVVSLVTGLQWKQREQMEGGNRGAEKPRGASDGCGFICRAAQII